MTDAWAAPPELHQWLRKRLGPDDVVLELGSGSGTLELAQICGHVYSVEHDRMFMRPSTDRVTYIHAPLDRGWYDRDVLRERLPKGYSCLLVDGPPGDLRHAFEHYVDLFLDVPVVFDDANRAGVMRLASVVAERRGLASITLEILRSGRAFAALGWDR